MLLPTADAHPENRKKKQKLGNAGKYKIGWGKNQRQKWTTHVGQRDDGIFLWELPLGLGRQIPRQPLRGC